MSDETQAEKDARVARAFAAASVARDDGPRADRSAADVVEGYAMELLDHLDGSVPRALSAARAACLAAAGEVAHPGRWRSAMLAVELCRRAAHLAGHDGGDPEPPAPAVGAPVADAVGQAGAEHPHAGRAGAAPSEAAPS
jgi:hypothetical protein